MLLSAAAPADVSSPETALAVATVLAALVGARFGGRAVFGWWEPALAALAGKKRLAILTCCLCPLVLRALLLPWHPIPQPRVNDEFTFLLGADTLAHGRLTNPQHPAWAHFETMHILVRPVHVSAFPIGPSVVLAIGQVVFSHPWIGVWLSLGLMCGAVCWMLQGWLPPRWALLGAALVVVRFSVATYWMNSYWGGALAATGGALVLGALARLLRAAPHWRMGVVLGVGVTILANSRPFEGAVFSLGVAVWLLVHLLGRSRPPVRVAFRQILLPLSLVLGLAAAGLGYYNARITGQPWVLPYVLYRNTMTMAPHFVWQSPRPEPLYNNRDLRAFYLHWEMHSYHVARDAFAASLAPKGRIYWRFYLGPLLTLPLLALPRLWRNRAARGALLLAAGFTLALAGQVWCYPHYAAPATGLVILIVTMSLRHLRLWRPSRLHIGVALVRCLPLTCVLFLGIQIFAGARPTDGPDKVSAGWRWPPLAMERARVLGQLESLPGQHLVFVRYAATHDPGDEWVYNQADIDASRVVWARELDRTSNAALMSRFPGRRAWLVEPDLSSPQPVPYASAPQRPMPFVAVGAPGIAVLRSPEELRRRLLAQSPDTAQPTRACDVWNYEFMVATGVDGPNADKGCFAGTDRGQLVTFDHWFTWLLSQR